MVYEVTVVETEWELKKAFLVILRDITQLRIKEIGLQQAIDEAEARTAELEIMRFVADQLNQGEGRLDAVASLGVTNWFMAVDPSQIDTIEYCYLEGQQGVYIETRQGFEVDGVEIKARLDFAAGAIDYRGLCKNTVAA